MSIQTPRHAETNTVSYLVGGRIVTLPIKGNVDASVVGAFPPKQVIGDYTRADHEVLSMLVQSDWIGGGQITRSDEAVDINRYKGIATLETRYPQAVTLLPLVESVVGTGAIRPLGDLGGVFYYADNLDIWTADGTTVVDTTDNLTALPVFKPELFTGNTGATRMYIPQGASGYDVWDGLTITHKATAEPVNFVRWGVQLWCVEADGTIRRSLDGDTWTDVVKADPANTMRGLLKFYDRNDNPALILIDDQGIQAVDAAAQEIWDTEFHDIPPQDEAGVAFTKWRADAFYAFGMGIFRYTFSTRNAQGLDRDHGVPAEYRGAQVDLLGTMNDLFSLVEGVSVAGEADEPSFELEGEEEYSVLIAPGTARSFLARYDGVGWHTLWAAAQDAGSPTWMFVSRTSEGGMLYWGVGSTLYMTQLSAAFQNPKENQQARFALTGRIESSHLDMGMAGGRQALSAIEVRTKDCTATEPIRVYYRTDLRDWTLLGTVTTGSVSGDEKVSLFRVGADGTFPDRYATPVYKGEMFSWVQYAIEMDRDPADDTKSPMLVAVGIIHLKIPGTVRSYSFTVDCTSASMDRAFGLGNDERRRFVEGMVDWGRADDEEGPFFGFLHNNHWSNVRQTGAAGVNFSGLDTRGDVRVTVLDVYEEADGPLDVLPEYS